MALALGATDVVDAREGDSAEAVRDLTDGGAHYVVEAAGVASVGAQAFRATAKRGICVLTGIAPPEATISLDWSALVTGRTIRGAVLGSSNPAEFLPRMIDWYRQGRFDYTQMITTYPLSDINVAAEALLTGAAVKPVLLPRPAAGS
jgi:aryl-alcohol dehydrogenase